MPAWSVETRRAPPSRHCRGARVYGHTTTAMHDLLSVEGVTPENESLHSTLSSTFKKVRLKSGFVIGCISPHPFHATHPTPSSRPFRFALHWCNKQCLPGRWKPDVLSTPPRRRRDARVYGHTPIRTSCMHDMSTLPAPSTKSCCNRRRSSI